MATFETQIVTATKENVCEHCFGKIQPGEQIVFYSKKPRGVGHIQCHLAARRKARA